MRKLIIVLVAGAFLTLGAGSADATQSLTGPAAKHYVKKAMTQEFHNAFKYGYAKRIRGCKRLSRVRMRCTASWVIGDSSYKGKVAIWYRGRYYLYSFRIKATNEYCVATGGHNCSKIYSGHS